MRNIILVTLSLFAIEAVAQAQTEVFRLPVTTSLAKLTANLEHPGTVNSEEAPGSKTQNLEVPLNNCETWGGAEHCSGSWSSPLKIDDAEFLYYVNIYNKKGSEEHSIVLLICLEGAKTPAECKRWISNQIDFKGDVAPRVSLYDSGHTNFSPAHPAFYQPRLDIGAVH